MNIILIIETLWLILRSYKSIFTCHYQLEKENFIPSITNFMHNLDNHFEHNENKKTVIAPLLTKLYWITKSSVLLHK